MCAAAISAGDNARTRISGMDRQQQTHRCAICGTPEQLLRCAKCKSVYYCSTGHQHMDWPAHRQDCRLLARQKNNNKIQQLQQAVAATSLDGSGAGATANCSTAQMMTPATQAQSWPDEVDNILNYFGSAADSDVAKSATALNPSNRNYGSNGYGNVESFNGKLLPPPPSYHAGPQASSSSNQSEKSSSYQIGQADSSFLGTGNERRYEDLCRNIINDMNQYGLSVVDDFLGMEKGLKILNEVRSMYNAGAFHDGQLVHNMKTDAQSAVRGDKIRGDKIKWVGGTEPGCSNVWYLTNQIDSVIYRVNTMKENGILGNYHIRERTRAMVACYPGSGTHYVMHVDNPNKDGRVITAIYYLNLNWDARESGGILRIRPTPGATVADIEPKFDRLIFFWSDIRNPHEVQPAHRTRYAITVWYFDAEEREQALNRAKQENSDNNAVAAAQRAEADSTTPAAGRALTPATMSTGSALNANVPPGSACAAATSSEICT